MLITYYSNRLENLAKALAEVVGQPQRTALARENILVQSNGMARWLSMHLADCLGVCANINFAFPAAFLWDTFRALLDDVPEISGFDREILTWRVMQLLVTLGDDECFRPLHAYLKDGDDRRCFQLAQRIAGIFEQYLIYRPDWIDDWEQGEKEHWQAALWRRLCAGRDKDHRVIQQKRFLQALNSPVVEQLPQRLSLLGISALPPAQLDLLAAIGKHSDVYLFLLNPCQEYWGDIVADRDIARREDITLDPAEQYLEVGNPLLASLGKQGRDFIDLIQNLNAREIDDYREAESTTLLALLQSDVLNLRQRGETVPQTVVDQQDRSVQIHACHSALREVEVLHDQLLALFEADSGLRPADVVIMTPDIEAYSPFIEAVFATIDDERRIPFSIADRGLRQEKPLIDIFMRLLDLPGSRFTADRLLEFLDVPAIRRRFDILDNDLSTIQSWVRDTEIRWGIDETSRAAINLPPTREHSWQAGLERLLLGFALPGKNERLWRNVLPFDDVEGSQAQLMGRFQSFLRTAFEYDRQAIKMLPLNEWVKLLNRMLDDFFTAHDNEEEQIQAIRSALQKLLDNNTDTNTNTNFAQSRFDHPLSLALIKTALSQILEGETGGSGFFSGGVTFCTMVPMRSIPFRVICLIGMNSDAYPRPQRSPDFDLMAADFRKGDRSRRQDDRYLFLEAVLSARSALYLSYIGKDIRDNSVLPPCVLISELMDVIEQGFICKSASIHEHILTVHPLQAFSPAYFVTENANTNGQVNTRPQLFSYSRELAELSRRSAHLRRDPPPFIAAEIPPPDDNERTVEVNQLITFFDNPTRFMLRQRLGLILHSELGELESSEPFVLNGLAGYHLLETILPMQLHGQQAGQGLKLLRAAGALPHGQVGDSTFAQAWESMQLFSGRIKRALGKTDAAINNPSDAGFEFGKTPLEIDIRIDGKRIYGLLPHVYDCGLIDYRPGKINARDKLRLWIRHLLLNAADIDGIEPRSLWLGLDDTFVLRAVPDPLPRLRQLLDLYYQGLRKPLHFFPKSAYAYTESRRQKKPTASPERAAAHVWRGTEYSRGEEDDLYYRLVFRGSDPLDEMFCTLAWCVFKPVFEYSDKP